MYKDVAYGKIVTMKKATLWILEQKDCTQELATVLANAYVVLPIRQALV